MGKKFAREGRHIDVDRTGLHGSLLLLTAQYWPNVNTSYFDLNLGI